MVRIKLLLGNGGYTRVFPQTVLNLKRVTQGMGTFWDSPQFGSLVPQGDRKNDTDVAGGPQPFMGVGGGINTREVKNKNNSWAVAEKFYRRVLRIY